MDTARLEQLRESIRGTLTTPADEGYDSRTAGLQRDDRQASARRSCARERRRRDDRRQVRRGRTTCRSRSAAAAHSVPGFGTCDDGLVIDLSSMRGVRVDPLNQTARVERRRDLG